MKPALLSIVIPVFHEEKNIAKVLFFINQKIKTSHETIIIYDSSKDPTVIAAKDYIKAHKKQKISLIKNSEGTKSGVMNAIKTGFKKSKGQAVVVVMADLADDIGQIDAMYTLIQKGNDIVCASRFMKNGKKIGGPFIKTLLTRIACFTLFHIFRIPTHDATNAFKMYKKSVLKNIKIESTGGFEYSLEIIVKSFKKGYRITEIPTVWKDREEGKSNFKIMSWLPQYIKWYGQLISYSFNTNKIVMYIRSHAIFWQIALLFVVSFLTLLQIGGKITNGIQISDTLDFSWQTDTVERFLHGFIAGKDYIFTYGPLYQFISSLPSLLFKLPSYIGILYVPLLENIVISILLIWLVSKVVKDNFQRIFLSVFLLIILGIGTGLNGSILLRVLLPMCFAIFWFKTLGKRRQLVLAAIPTILGLYSYDLFVQCVFLALGISVMYLFLQKKNIVLNISVLFSTILFQILGSFFISHNMQYIQYSFATLSDYYAIMNIVWSPGKSYYLFTFLLALIVLLIPYLASDEYPKEQKMLFLVMSFVSLLSLRIGFVRSDSGHVEMSLYATIITVFLLLSLLAKKKNMIAILFIAVLFPLSPFTQNYFSSFSLRNIKNVFITIQQKPSFFRVYSLFDKMFTKEDLNYFKKIIAQNPGKVMVYPYDNYLLNIYNQTYNSFALQFYAYSNSSVEQKSVQMLANNPPTYIILEIDSHGALALDDISNFTRNPLIAKWMFAHYFVEKSTKHYLVLKYQIKQKSTHLAKSCYFYTINISIPKTISFIKQPLYKYPKENSRLPIKSGINSYLIIPNSTDVTTLAAIFLQNTDYTNTYTYGENIHLAKINPFNGKAMQLTLPGTITCYY
ncbi:MAG TPA: glycosyltransferase [Patescibacteria group bacterium]